MTRKKVKLAWVASENSRALRLKKRKVGLVKKVRELTILCDVKACMIIFSPNEAEPMVWPSFEAARDLLDDYFALPDIEKKKKETSIESYLKEKTKKVHEQLKKNHKKNMEYVVDQLMVQLHRGRRIVDLNLSEIYALLSFSKDKIIVCRKRLDFMQHPPLREPPVYLFEAQSNELGTTTNDVFIGSGQNERARRADETSKRISIRALRENQSHYLMDRWFFTSSELPEPKLYQQIGMDRVYYPNPRSYLPYQGSSSNGNPNLEMEPVGHQVMTFHGLVGSVSQPLQHTNMNSNPIMAISQLRQYPFGFMSSEFGVKQEGDSLFHMSNNIVPSNDGLRQEPPPNGTTDEDADAASFDINRVWPGIYNHHF